MAVEDLYTTYEFPKTAVLMGHARGVIFLAAAARAVPVISYAPTELKRAVTGHGRASKEQVQAMVQRLLRLAEPPHPGPRLRRAGAGHLPCLSGVDAGRMHSHERLDYKSVSVRVIRVRRFVSPSVYVRVQPIRI